jgi:hypothetical protein
MKVNLFWAFAKPALLVIAILGQATLAVQAFQGGIACTQPTVFSDQGPDTFALVPRAAVDPFGHVHVVWSGGITESYPDTNSIIYTSLQDEQWSNPVDILAVDGYASVDSLVATPENNLVASWRYREPSSSGLRVSRSSLENPKSARSWETTTIFPINTMDSALFVDSAGDIHLGFIVHDAATGSGSLGYTRSEDDGETWEQPIEFASYDATTEARRFVTIYANDAGLVQMAWAVSTQEEEGWT